MAEQELQVHEKKEVRQAGEPTKPVKQFVPAVDIYESADAVTVLAEMAGVDKDGVEISLEEGVLTIKGIMGEQGNDDEKYLLREYETGNYMRRFAVSETIDQEKINATMADGILSLVLPKVEPAKPRKIEVKAG